MFGPVPAKYSFIVWLCGLLAFAGLGVWFSYAVPLSATVMAALGMTFGAGVVVLFLHDFSHHGHRRP